MHRRISILLCLLLAGAVINVAVAWGCLFSLKKRPVFPTILGQYAWDRVPDDEAIRAVAKHFGREPDEYDGVIQTASDRGFGWIYRSMTVAFPVEPDLAEGIDDIEAGWPFKSLRGGAWDRSFDI